MRTAFHRRVLPRVLSLLLPLLLPALSGAAVAMERERAAAVQPMEIERTDGGWRASLVWAGCPVAMNYQDYNHVLHFSNPCRQPATTKYGQIIAMLQQIWAIAAPELPLYLHLGDLATTLPEVTMQAARTAARDPLWDAERAQVDAEFARGAYVALFRRYPLLHELRQALDSIGYASEIHAAERMRLGPPGVVLGASAPATGVLPLNGDLWLVLTEKPGSRLPR